MRFKEGVELTRIDNGYNNSLGEFIYIGVQPVTVEGMFIVAEVYKSLGITGARATITSVCDGKHKEGSKHYEGLAFDCRTWKDSLGNQMSPKEKSVLAKYCSDALGDDWDVVIERTHLHCEYDPE